MAKTKAKKEYKIVKKRSGRYAVVKGGKYVNGEDKVQILSKEGLIKLTPKKAPEAAEAASEEAPAES